MKYLPIVFLAVFSGEVCAQIPSYQALLADALKEFGNISGGLALNDKCKFLDAEASMAFRTHVEGIQPVLASEIGSSELILKIKDDAQHVAESEPYSSCGDKAKEIVEQTSGHAGRWYEQMRRIQSHGAS